VDTVRTELENRIDDYVGTVMTAHPEWADQQETYQDVLKALLPNTVLNVLFEETERPEITAYEPEDFEECTLCGGPSEPLVWLDTSDGHDYGYLTQIDTYHYTLRGWHFGDGYQLSFLINQGVPNGTYYNFQVEVDTSTMWYSAGNSQFAFSTPSPTPDYQGDGPIPTNLTSNNIRVRDVNEDFLVTLTLIPVV